MDFIDARISDLKEVASKFSTEFAGLAAEAADAKPAPDSWSVNECMDHLVVSSGRYHAPFLALAEGRPLPGNFWAKVPFWPKLWGKLILDSVRPETARKTKTFPVFVPSKSQYGRNVLPDLLAADRALADLIGRLRSVDLDKVVITSPTAPFVVYTLRTCIEILVEHQKRHFNQAKRVATFTAGKAEAA